MLLCAGYEDFMRLLLAAPRGFCAGVEMAIKALNLMLERFGPPVYCYHQVVHNHTVVAEFVQRGVVFVDSVEQVPNGARLAFSAHGVAPQIRAEAAQRSIDVVDLSCPLVQKVHQEARNFAREDRTIALIGHRGHDEVMGVMGEAPGKIVLIENIEHIRALNFDGNLRFAYLTQTTLSIDETRDIVHELKRRVPDIVGPSSQDICYATQNRQDAIRQLARAADLVLVVGSANSSNTVNLAEAAHQEGKPSYRIADVSEIRMEWLDQVETVALTSGASVPETIVQEVVSYFRDRWHAQVEEHIVKKENMHFALPAGL